jgi:hypothetical protein
VIGEWAEVAFRWMCGMKCFCFEYLHVGEGWWMVDDVLGVNCFRVEEGGW